MAETASAWCTVANPEAVPVEAAKAVAEATRSGGLRGQRRPQRRRASRESVRLGLETREAELMGLGGHGDVCAAQVAPSVIVERRTDGSVALKVFAHPSSSPSTPHSRGNI